MKLSPRPVASFRGRLLSLGGPDVPSQRRAAGRVIISSPSDLTTGLHRKAFTIGNGSGQVAMPGAGAAENDDEYYLLGVADPTNAVPEQDVDPVNDDNTAVFTGVYNSPSVNGDVYVFGRVTADTVTIHPNGWQLTFNSDTFDYANALPAKYRVRTYGGDDAVIASGSSRPVWVHGGPGTMCLEVEQPTIRSMAVAGNDWLEGGPGNDTLIGGDGEDSYKFDADGPLGQDTIVDAGSWDGLWFQDTTTQAVTVDLSQTEPQVVNPKPDADALSGGCNVEGCRWQWR